MADTPDRILRLNAVLDRTGLSRSTLYRKNADRHVPEERQYQHALRGLATIGRRGVVAQSDAL